jgi:hypothetical protein
MLGAVEKLDDAPAHGIVAAALDAKKRAVADASDSAWSCAARRDDADDGRGAVGILVPLGWPGQQFAVAIPAGDVGEHDRGQGAGRAEALAAPLDLTFVGQLAQHAVERGTVGVLGTEGAGDFARANLAAVLADEGSEFLSRG